MQAKSIWCAITGVFLCMAVGILWFVFSPPDAIGEVPDWVEKIREGKHIDLEKIETEEIDAWLKIRLRRGETTREEVFSLLGDPRDKKSAGSPFGADLDRPERDKIESFQYLLWYGDSVNWTSLGVDFDRETGKLVDFGIGHCICGFCPHVLAHDGRRWRLEGKMLAGRVGENRAGSDLLVLPRLNAVNGIARVQLANWAPEFEALREPRLLAVSLRPGEALDMNVRGEPVVWNAIREIEIDDLASPLGDDQNDLASGDLLIVEVKNTARLETYLRSVFLDERPDHMNTGLIVDFGEAGTVEVPAVGTKFLRRVAVPIPVGATTVQFRGYHDFWYSRRAWIGTQAEFADRSNWHEPIDLTAQEINLGPMESTELRFPVEQPGDLAFALQLSGFYEFRSN